MNEYVMGDDEKWLRFYSDETKFVIIMNQKNL